MMPRLTRAESAALDPEIRRPWALGMGKVEIAARLGLTAGQMAGKRTCLNLHSVARLRASDLAPVHPAIREARTLFPGMARSPLGQPGAALILKPGHHSATRPALLHFATPLDRKTATKCEACGRSISTTSMWTFNPQTFAQPPRGLTPCGALSPP
jgi:hypothetical protein